MHHVNTTEFARAEAPEHIMQYLKGVTGAVAGAAARIPFAVAATRRGR